MDWTSLDELALVREAQVQLRQRLRALEADPLEPAAGEDMVRTLTSSQISQARLARDRQRALGERAS